MQSRAAPEEALLQGEALYQQCLQPKLLESRRQRCYQHPETVLEGCLPVEEEEHQPQGPGELDQAVVFQEEEGAV